MPTTLTKEELSDVDFVKLAAVQACEHNGSTVPQEHAVLLVPHLRAVERHAMHEGMRVGSFREVIVVDANGEPRERFNRPFSLDELVNELKAKGLIRYPL